jgi:hypothetical protein
MIELEASTCADSADNVLPFEGLPLLSLPVSVCQEGNDQMATRKRGGQKDGAFLRKSTHCV